MGTAGASARLFAQTRQAAAQGAQLVVWPEGSLGIDLRRQRTADFQALAAETGVYPVIGYAITDAPAATILLTSVALGRAADLAGRLGGLALHRGRGRVHGAGLAHPPRTADQQGGYGPPALSTLNEGTIG